MTSYSVTFEASEFNVSVNAPIQFGFSIKLPEFNIEGLGIMAIEVPIGSTPFHVVLVAKSAPPRNTRLPYPEGLPAPVWSGFDTNLATYVVDANGRGVVLTPLENLGRFTVSATIEGFAPATLEVVLTEEKVDHFDLEVEPAAPPAP